MCLFTCRMSMTIKMSVCLCLSVHVCLSVCLSACLSVCLATFQLRYNDQSWCSVLHTTKRRFTACSCFSVAIVMSLLQFRACLKKVLMLGQQIIMDELHYTLQHPREMWTWVCRLRVPPSLFLSIIFIPLLNSFTTNCSWS